MYPIAKEIAYTFGARMRAEENAVTFWCDGVVIARIETFPAWPAQSMVIDVLRTGLVFFKVADKDEVDAAIAVSGY